MTRAVMVWCFINWRRRMRAVIQKCVRGSVTVTTPSSSVTRSIGRGAVVLVGIGHDDDAQDVEYVLRKTFNTKLWSSSSEDGSKAWSRSIRDENLDVLFVSQFTLHAELKGNKPSFHRALPPSSAKAMYESFLRKAREEYGGVIEDGEFGATMEVNIVNDGPVTIIVDSKNRN